MNRIKIKNINFVLDCLHVTFSDGQSISVPISSSTRLENANTKQRENWVLLGKGLGVHWPDIDEDLSVDNFLNSYSKAKYNKTPNKALHPTAHSAGV
jgi:hypothetical protein